MVGTMKARKNDDVLLAGLKTRIMSLKTILCDTIQTKHNIQYNVNIALKTILSVKREQWRVSLMFCLKTIYSGDSLTKNELQLYYDMTQQCLHRSAPKYVREKCIGLYCPAG